MRRKALENKHCRFNFYLYICMVV